MLSSLDDFIEMMNQQHAANMAAIHEPQPAGQQQEQPVQEEREVQLLRQRLKGASARASTAAAMRARFRRVAPGAR